MDGKSIKTEPLYAGGVVFHDLRRSPTFYFNDPLDSVNYFLPRKTLDVIADDAEVSRISDLKFTPGVGIMDRVVEGLTQVLLPASSDFMRFDVIDHGSWLATIGQRAKAVMVVLGNPLIARTMLRHDVGAGLNVPVRIFIYQHQDGKTRVAYDLPSTLMSNLKGDPVAEAASKLDAKLVALAERISGVKADARACSD